jgi:hypothetical protein
LGRPPVPPLLGVGVLWSPGDRAGAWRRTARARGGRCRERWTSGGVSSAGSSGWPRRRRTGTAGPTCWRTEQSREVRRARGSISSPPRPVVGAPARGGGCRRWARRVSLRMATACRSFSLGAAYGETARRRVHRDAGSTATVPRPPYAGLARRRHVAARLGAGALAPEHGEDAVGALFYFVCTISKMHNSLKCQLTSKSPNSKVVEEL